MRVCRVSVVPTLLNCKSGSEREGSVLADALAMVYLLVRSESPTCPIYSDSHVVLELALCISTSKIPVCAIMRRPVMQKYIYITQSFTRCALQRSPTQNILHICVRPTLKKHANHIDVSGSGC